MKPSSDREAITLIIEGLIERGVTPTLCRDGDSQDTPFTDVDSAVDWLTSCDESVLFVDLPEPDPASGIGSSYVYFVLGNDPEEVACDFGVSMSPYLDPIIDPWWK